MTRRAAGRTSHEVFSVDERLDQLRLLARLGLSTVEYEVSGSMDIGAIRRAVWAAHGREGAVVLVLDAAGALRSMVKLKSMCARGAGG